MNGPRRVRYSDIESWAKLTGRSPRPHEIEALFTLDVALLVPDPKHRAA